MPRRSNEEAAKTRTAIIDRAVATASIEGLEGVTIGRLADDLKLSKAGVIGHFGTKVELQRAALHSAFAIFTEQVWAPAAKKPRGMPRLVAIADAWVKHLTNSPFPGGCFMCTVSTEWDARHGQLHDEVRQGWETWLGRLALEASRAVEAGELDADPEQVAFEMQAIAMGLNQSIQLLGDRRGPARARAAYARLLQRD